MKKLYIGLLVTMASWLSASGQCGITNGNFESTNTSFYTFAKNATSVENFSIANCNVDTSAYSTFSMSTLTNQFLNEGGTLVSATSGLYYGPYDQTMFDLGTLIYRVAPGTGGNQAIKLNRSTGGTDITSMSFDMTSAPAAIIFDYSLIIENPHPDEPNKQPFFAVRLYSGSTVIYDDLCIKADPENDIFVDSYTENILYTDWECQTIPVPAAYIGDPITVEFVIADCGYNQHFATVYLDNIRCGTTCNAFGSIALDVIEKSCPDEPFDVCGEFTPPVGMSADTGTLDLILVDSSGTETPLSVSPTISGNTFCFEVDPSVFGSSPSGSYEFKVTMEFTNGTTDFLFSGTSTSISPDVSFEPVSPSIYIYPAPNAGDLLYWDDVSDSYTLEFKADLVCCGESDQPGHIPLPYGYYTITTTDNFVPLSQVIVAMGSPRCFRWRILTDCGWSGWCCLSAVEGPFVNPFAPGCYDEAEECVAVTIPNTTPHIVDSGETIMVDWKSSITAHNLIENGGEAYYVAQNYIELLPTFYSENGSLFSATIEECAEAGELPTEPEPRFNMAMQNEDNIIQKIIADDFTVHPNPTNGRITVTGETAAGVFTIIDITGKELMRIENGEGANQVNIDLSGLTTGVYFVSADGVMIQKIIRN